jgi:hypothetical protein
MHAFHHPRFDSSIAFTIAKKLYCLSFIDTAVALLTRIPTPEEYELEKAYKG